MVKEEFMLPLDGIKSEHIKTRERFAFDGIFGGIFFITNLKILY